MLRNKKNLGILGGGQLAKMIAMAAYNIGLGVYIYTNSESDCALEIVNENNTFIGEYSDITMIDKFYKSVDFITFEFENISNICLDFLIKKTNVFPSASILKICQNRIKEKEFLNSIGIPTAIYHIVDIHNPNTLEYLKNILIKKEGIILKTATLGYDGKGQYKIDTDSIDEIFTNIKEIYSSNKIINIEDVQYIAEEIENFSYEASIIVSRNSIGEITFFPITRNIHEQGILKYSFPINDIDIDVKNIIELYAKKIAEKLNLIGILAIECFVNESNQNKNRRVIVNEMAPRPHNSGHHTMDSCNISQFEQLVSIIYNDINIPPVLISQYIMVNIIGKNILLESQNNMESFSHIINNIHGYNTNIDKISIKKYDYGKKEIKDQRKMGHTNIIIHT